MGRGPVQVPVEAEASGVVVLDLLSLPPSKKNAWRRGKSGKVYDPTKGAQTGILFQIRNQWGRRAPIEYAEVEAEFYGPRGNKDLDNMFTTLLDLLRQAGVIRNDSAARLRRIMAVWNYAEAEGTRVRVKRHQP